MKFLEKDLEDLIFSTDNEILDERGLNIEGLKIRQVNLGSYGIADLITVNKFTDVTDSGVYHFFIITVFELKKSNIDLNAYSQLVRYMKGVDHYLNDRRDFLGNHDDYNFTIKGVLIGSNVSEDVIYLPDFNSKIKNYTYTYNFNGLFFKEEYNYRLTKPNFNL